MKKISIPGTDLVVSNVCLGGGGHGYDTTLAERLIDEYLDYGGNFLDTANIYGKWQPGGGTADSELFLGEYIAKRGVRDRIVLDTKGGSPYYDTRDIPRCTPHEIREDMEESLRNLRVDYVDLYWLHHDDPAQEVGALLEVLNGFVKEGKTRYFGCSNWAPERIDEAFDYAHAHQLSCFVGDQVMFNLGCRNRERLEQEVMVGMDEKLYALHKRRNLLAAAYSSQAQGFFSFFTREDFLTNPRYTQSREFHDNEISRIRAQRVSEYARHKALDPTQVALAWVLTVPDFPTVAVISARDQRELSLSMEASMLEMDLETRAFLGSNTI